jgi:hypothetical protein
MYYARGEGGYFLQSLKVYIHVYRDDAGMGPTFSALKYMIGL